MGLIVLYDPDTGRWVDNNDPDLDHASLQACVQHAGAPDGAVDVILPTEVGIHSQVSVNKAQKRNIKQLLPALAETQLSVAVERVTLVPIAGIDAQTQGFIAVSSELIESVTEQAEDAGVQVRGVFLESSLLHDKDIDRVLVGDDRVVCCASGAGFVAHSHTETSITNELGRNSRDVEVVVAGGDGAQSYGERLFEELSSAGLNGQVRIEDAVRSDVIAHGVVSKRVSALYREKVASSSVIPFPKAAATALVAVVLATVSHSTMLHLEAARYEQSADRGLEIAREIVEDALGEDVEFSIPGYRDVMLGLTASGSNNGDSLLLDQMAWVDIVAESVDLKQISYRRGVFEATVEAERVGDLKELEDLLKPMTDEVAVSGSRNGDVVSGDVRIEVTNESD